jgi:hypothetical protein
MKYFTPKLIVMGRSEDEDVLDQQDRLWRAAGERYAEHLAQVKESFPDGLRKLFHRYYLHDALIHRIGRKDRFFLIELQLDTPPRSFLTLRYRLLQPVEIHRESLPPSSRSQGAAVQWLYAEVERLSREEVLRSPSSSTWINNKWLTQAATFDEEVDRDWPFWAHRILLSNGWELPVFFHDVEVEEYESLLVPAAANGMLNACDPT